MAGVFVSYWCEDLHGARSLHESLKRIVSPKTFSWTWNPLTAPTL